MSLRAVPTHLCMGEAVPFGQRWAYHTRHPIEAILTTEYFLPVRQMLRVGDEVRVCRVIDGRVRQLFDLIVVQILATAVEIHLRGEITEVPETAEKPKPPEPVVDERYIGSNGRVSWNVGKRLYDVFDGATLVAEVPSKAEALQIAQGEVPLPEKVFEAA